MRTILSLVLIALPFGACDDTSNSRVPAPPQATAETKAPPVQSSDPSDWLVTGPTDDARYARCAGLSFEKPVQWVWIKPAMQFRTLQYSIPGQDGSGAADLIFSVFASGEGGPVDANIERWIGQFGGVEGEPPRVERSTSEVAGMPVSMVELEGSYAGMGAAAPRSGWAQLGVIIQAPGRNVFVRLLGPAKTVLANKGDFDAMIDSARSDIATGTGS